MNKPPSQGGRLRDLRGKRGFILTGISGSHTLFHAFQHSLLVLFPNIRETFALSNLQTTTISAVQEVVAGVIDLPGGVGMDLFKRYWGVVMTLCMGGFGIGWMVVGTAPGYLTVLSGMAIVSASSSLWHLPAMAALSNRFAERRGFALSVYGVGGNVGEILGPATTGLLLGILTWQSIIGSYALLPLLLMFPVYWTFRDIGGRRPSGPSAAERVSLPDQLAYTRKMFRNGLLWGIIAVAGLRGMAFVAFTAVIALYAKDVLDLSDQTRGIYFSLLGVVGMTASPVLGHLSDRFGRKRVLVPNLLALGVLTLLMAWYGHLGAFPVLLLLMGVFLYSDQPVLTAAALDVTGRRTTTTAIGFVSFSRLALSAPSPLIAGWLYRPEAVHAVFYYIAGLFFLAACGLFLLPLRKGCQAAPGGAQQ
jgi:MFS family permease